jgi:hypothetical protein
MDKTFLLDHLEEQRQSTPSKMGLILFKPECPLEELRAFDEYCVNQGIHLLTQGRARLSPSAIIALYPAIFRFSKEDLLFGIDWKEQTLNYLQSTDCVYFLVRGVSIHEKLTAFKYALRARYGKVTHPEEILSPEAFLETVVKNFVHVVDAEELPNALWLLSRKFH